MIGKFVDDLKDKVLIHASYVRVFSTPDGERVLRHILKMGGAHKAAHVPGDSHTSAMNEGKRIMALSIVKFALRDHYKMVQLLEKGLQDDS